MVSSYPLKHNLKEHDYKNIVGYLHIHFHYVTRLKCMNASLQFVAAKLLSNITKTKD